MPSQSRSTKHKPAHTTTDIDSAALDQKLFLLRQDIRDELEHRIESIRSETQVQYKLDADSLRTQQKRNLKIALRILGFLGLTSIGGIYAAFNWASRGIEDAFQAEVNSIRAKVSQRLDAEFQTDRIQNLIGQTAQRYTIGEVQKYISRRVDSAIVPVQASLDLKLKLYNNELVVINSLVDIYELESSARNGSRSAFEKLRTYAAKNDRLSVSAQNRISAIKSIYSVLRFPQGVMIGDVSAVKGGKPVSFDSLSPAEMVFLLSDKNASLDQVHKMVTHMWSKPSKDLNGPLLSLLRTSDNLAASVAACALLAHANGERADIFDFSGWIRAIQ